MQELAVQRRMVEVAIRLPGQEVVRGHLFLAMTAKGHAGPETVLDLMNEAEPFFVLRVEGQPPVRLVNKDQVVEIEVDSAEAGGGSQDSAAVAKEEEMAVSFRDGFVLEGRALVEMPPTKSRLIDFLNHSERFFALVGEDRAHIVNRRHIVQITPGR